MSTNHMPSDPHGAVLWLYSETRRLSRVTEFLIERVARLEGEVAELKEQKARDDAHAQELLSQFAAREAMSEEPRPRRSDPEPGWEEAAEMRRAGSGEDGGEHV